MSTNKQVGGKIREIFIWKKNIREKRNAGKNSCLKSKAPIIDLLKKIKKIERKSVEGVRKMLANWKSSFRGNPVKYSGSLRYFVAERPWTIEVVDVHSRKGRVGTGTSCKVCCSLINTWITRTIKGNLHPSLQFTSERLSFLNGGLFQLMCCMSSPSRADEFQSKAQDTQAVNLPWSIERYLRR